MSERKKYGLPGYGGRILNGVYSTVLKERLAGLIAAFSAFDETGVPGIPYISAWLHDGSLMWYEFAGREFTRIFACGTEQLAELFREAVVEHRLFHRTEVEAGIREIARGSEELSSSRRGLRAEVTQRGSVEAAYKISLGAELVPVWFKDRARVETFGAEGISISYGFLTDVTNEMAHKDLLEQIGYIDQLTGLPNRLIMQRSLEIKIAEYERNHISDFVFLMLDLDHFKAVNDNFGHLAGDYVLATLAQVVGDVKRRSDEIGRYGGEEFYGLAVGDIAEGREFAERIRRRIEVTPFVFAGQLMPLTVSIGVAAASELQELTAENLINAADRRLYRAKQYGRNQVVWQTITL
ncbi:MAG: GGDEF domain-containing protein [Desulfobulbaceae bacterium]